MRHCLTGPQYLFMYPNPDKPEPKKMGLIFTTKITKEKKNKICNKAPNIATRLNFRVNFLTP